MARTGRPPKDERVVLKKYISFVMNNEDFRKLKYIGKKLNIGKSEVMRRAIRHLYRYVSMGGV